MKRRKIAYISGTRADFGLMTPVLEAIEKSDSLQLQLYATGMHLMPEFGNTIDYLKKQFPNTKTIPTIFASDDRLGMARFIGDYLKEVTNILDKVKSDFILIMGDRVEMLCTALASVYLGIPSAQLHGGERTSTVDEIARHAITKLVSLHFAATTNAADRIKRLGEDEWRIQVVGAPALDMILNQELPTREELFRKINIDPFKKIILVVQHPVTEQVAEAGKQMEETLKAVKSFNLPVVVIYPNADAGGREMIKVIERRKHDSMFHIFPSLEYKDFLALEREAAVMVGNSSAGMIESSSFHTPVVNIGTRQNGRERSGNVIDVDYDYEMITAAIKKSLFDKSYLNRLNRLKNPWGDGHASERVVKILSSINLNSKLLQKQITY